MFIIALTGFGIQTHRLDSTRQQLEHYRIEFTAAQNRQYEIADIVRRESEVLSQSANTISDIRKQISEIRKSYEDMERILYRDLNHSN